ncbi:MAG: hypothetical protein KKE62_16035 [Proteobacteria bacterium]|jgi:hypothetical protein|nr:hypothetical protein [Pseudomonadota bacterium]MBU1387894.1 hypothetical protein [Pseudomonadota bacterium]MBU1544340.1 hypothetical protein [Pseudomonadota bacterium]MBU2429318.1 hypothetical protein [Pseudomonadota bacterium]
MKTVNGTLNMSVNIECPACECPIDLLCINKFTDEERIYQRILKNPFGCEHLGDELCCPECEEIFIVGKIEW